MPCVLLAFTLLLLWPAFAVAQTSCLLAWQAPLTMENGEPLTQVDFYTAYQSDNAVFMTSVVTKIDGDAVTQALPCTDGQYFYLTATACTNPMAQTGCQESKPSNVIQAQKPLAVTIPSPPTLIVIDLGPSPVPVEPPPDPITIPNVGYYLLLSPHADRREPVALDGQVLSGTVYVFAERVVHLAFQEPPAITRVNFWLVPLPTASNPYRSENGYPYDLGGGSATQADPWDTRMLPNGEQTISARFLLDDGTREEVSATVTVAN
jgi:hypothetical protein